MSLSDTQRIEILILLGCGDKTRTQKQVCEIFNTRYSDRRISHSTVSRIENKFCEFGNVTDIPKSGRKCILDDEQKLDILLDIQDNPHKPTRQVAADNDISKTSILRLLKNEIYRPYKIHLDFLEEQLKLNKEPFDLPYLMIFDITLLSVNAGKHSPIPAADSDGLISHPRLQQKLGSGEGRKFILSQNLSYNVAIPIKKALSEGGCLITRLPNVCMPTCKNSIRVFRVPATTGMGMAYYIRHSIHGVLERFREGVNAVQFCIVFYHNVQVLFRECSYPKFINVLLTTQAAYFLYLFGCFYYNQYVKSQNRKAAERKTNGVVQNGVTKIAPVENGIDKTSENISNGKAKVVFPFKPPYCDSHIEFKKGTHGIQKYFPEALLKSEVAVMYWDRLIIDRTEFRVTARLVTTVPALEKSHAGKMEVDSVKEVFQRSEEKHNLKYAQYIGDGDNKTSKATLDLDPYNNDPKVMKKERVGHVEQNEKMRDAI
ncbi:hypothetical protein NQ318_005894 [Aromia moschata]|uniref:Mutator-like transposase domain-containing protein n=1 Tax=Aromia moschata TaxID=1265417 RepID=A0AAV8YTD8_9CUCU|nr:hypothetical protein NQ318_005894 [Aromia moschata]